MKIGFVKLVVRDLEAMQAFYTETFSMIVHRVIEDPGFTEVILKWPDVAEDNARLILFYHKDGRETVAGTNYGPLGLYVPEVDQIIAQAVAKGAVLIPPILDLPAFRIAFLNDPEGHELELLESRI